MCILFLFLFLFLLLFLFYFILFPFSIKIRFLFFAIKKPFLLNLCLPSSSSILFCVSEFLGFLCFFLLTVTIWCCNWSVVMAESLDDGEFWLPPQFLSDDDDDQESSATNKNNGRNSFGSTAFQSGRPSFPLEFGTFGGFSDFSSTAESLKGSSETESDLEDIVAGLTLHMARSTVDDGLDSDNAKVSTRS